MTDSNKGLRILIAEDNPADQQLITELLDASVIMVHSFTTAATLAVATDLLKQEVFDIILLDLSLPDSSGISTFKAIKQIAGKIPIIILSGLTDMKIAVEAISLGAQDYHIKEDLDEKTLTKTILYSIERKRKLENLREDNERYIAMSKAELDLKQSEEITRRIISAALDAIICIDTNGKITVWNPQAEKIFGWTQQEIIGTTLSETIIPPAYRERHEKGMSHYLATGEGPILNKLIEITAMNRAGQHFPVELSIVPLTEGGNQFFCAFVRDITGMKKTETELKQSNERFEMITSTTNDAVWEWDLETGKMWGNETHQQLYGLTMADPVPEESQWQQRLHPDDRGSIIKKQAEALASDTNVFITEYRFNSEKEGYKNIYDRCYIVRNAEGRAVRILGSMMDITERKKAENLISESEARYKALVENAPEALVVFDVDTRKFVSVSESALRLFKMSREELLEMGPMDVSPEYQPDGKLSAGSAMEKISETIAGGKPSFEWTHCDKEGNLIPCEVWLVRLPSETQVLIRGSIFDITERKKVELILKESEEKYRSVIEQASDFIMITDQQGNFIDANSSFFKTFGYTKEELLQLNINKFIDEEQLKIRPIRFDLLMKSEAILNERRMMTKDGEIIDVEANVKMLPDGRIMAIARDTRDRKKTEEQLSNERNLLRALIDNLPDYIYVKDTSFNYIINNRAFVRLVGAASETESASKNSIELFGEEVGQVNMEEDKRIIETGQTVIDRDEPIVTKDDEKLWLLTTKVPLKDQENKVIGILGISKDITERKEAERIIKESEEKYRTIIEQAPDGIFISNRDTFMVDVNQSGCNMMGYTKEELQKMKFTDLISPDDLRNNPIRMDDLNSGCIVLSERKVIRKDGSEISVEINAKLRPDGFYQSFIRDITDRNKAEQALKDSEERYRTLVEQAVDAIALYDRAGKILDVNTGSVKLLGYSKEELMGMHLSDILTKEEISMRPVQYDVLQKGESTVRQRMMRRKDGIIVQTEVRSQQLPDGRFLSVIRDLTERVKAQDQIKKEKELSDSIINSLPGLFYLIDESGKYIRWNKLKEEIGGYTANEMSQMSSLVFFEGKEKALVRQRIKDGFTNGVTDVEAHLVTKKGKRILFYFTGIAIDYEGKKCLMGTGIDISDRKKAEQELEESYKAIRKLTEHLQNIREEERAHMAREIHDELGQQLTVMKMDISWVNKKIGSKDEAVNARMKELLEMLDETVRSVRRISSDLRPSLLDDLGLTAAMEWQLTEFEKRFEIKADFKPHDTEIKLPESVKTALFRIFQESLTNVARHSKAKKVTVTLQKKNGSVILSVADNGVGYDKQNASSKKTLGILGMQERTSMIGGTYEISGKPGKGTKVVVTIPLMD